MTDRLPGGVGGLHLMWVPAVGPEEEQPVEQWLDVSHVGLPFRKDPENAAMLLINDNNDISWSLHHNLALNFESLITFVFF